MVATALAAAGTVLWMQNRYEAADQRHALDIVKSYRPSGGTSIPALLSSRHPDKSVTWTTAVESSCFQHIRVHAVVTDPVVPEPFLYAFVVDINGPSIHPANERGQQLIAAIEAPLPADNSAGAADSAAAASVSPAASTSPRAPASFAAP